MPMRKLIYKTIFLAFSILLLAKCTGNNNGGDSSDFYSADKSKLGIEIIDKDLGIKISPPKDWVLMPSSISKKIEAKSGVVNSPENFIYQPVYIFFDDSTSGICSIGKVNAGDSTLSQNSKINYYKSMLAAKYKENDLSLGSFTKSGIAFSQLKFKKENLLSIKLLFENKHGEIIQVDYTIPSNYYENTEQSIKASAGSIILE
jgi:hypothetical protein